MTTTENLIPCTPEDLLALIAETDVDVADTLNSTRPEAKDEFMTNSMLRLPQNTHDYLSLETVERNVNLLTDLIAEVEQNEGGAYAAKIQRIILMYANSCLAKNNFLLANARYNLKPSSQNAEVHRAANRALYGEPVYETFAALLYTRLDKIKERRQKGKLTADDLQILGELETLLEPLCIERPECGGFIPKPETIEAFGELVQAYLEPIFAMIPEDQETFTPEQTAELINKLFDDFLPEGSGWTTVVDANRTAINVNQVERCLHLAGKRANGDLDQLGLRKILGHEIGTHFMRAMIYETASIGMFRTGLPGYVSLEEGIAKAIEQAIAGKYEVAGLNHYISIGLAFFKGCDFRTVYEIQRRLIYLATGKKQDSLAFNSVQRAFRGTDELPNCKDLVYYNGSEQAWRLIEAGISNPEYLADNLFLNGKIDNADPEHLHIIYELKVNGIN